MKHSAFLEAPESTRRLFTGISSSFSEIIFGNFSSGDYVFTKEPMSYITIDYHDKGVGEEDRKVTGSLKIIVINESISFKDNAGLDDVVTHLPINNVSATDSTKGIYYTITRTDTCEFPTVWRYALYSFALGWNGPHDV